MSEVDTQTPTGLAPVREYWNALPCGTQHVTDERYTAEYFGEVERHRYAVEPYLFSFCQFTRWRGKKMLEVGVGAATDFLQWARAGARVHGVDLTPEGIEHARRRLEMEGLRAEDLRVMNAESLEYGDNEFDLVYSWGVIHHSTSIERALAEIVRVTRPGGTVKLMLYNRHSLAALFTWMYFGLMRGRPWRSVSYCFSNFVESPGTKAVTVREVRKMLDAHGVRDARIEPVITSEDILLGKPWWASAPARLAARILGDRAGFFIRIEFRKPA